MDPDRIDFSALDPARDPRRWERLVQATLARARPPAVPPLLMALAARRGTLALLAAAALLTWIPVWSGGRATAAVESVDPTLQLADWAGRGSIPEASVVSETLGTGVR